MLLVPAPAPAPGTNSSLLLGVVTDPTPPAPATPPTLLVLALVTDGLLLAMDLKLLKVLMPGAVAAIAGLNLLLPSVVTPLATVVTLPPDPTTLGPPPQTAPTPAGTGPPSIVPP